MRLGSMNDFFGMTHECVRSNRMVKLVRALIKYFKYLYSINGPRIIL